MIRTSWLNINLQTLQANFQAVQQFIGEHVAICAVVKADAYGLGVVPIAQKLATCGTKMLAVYNGDQARQLAVHGIDTDLLVLMPIHNLARTDALYHTAMAGHLHLTVHSLEHAKEVETIGRSFGIAMPVHIEIDTGMSRCGMSETEAAELIESLPGRRHLKLTGIFSHAASADTDPDFTNQQADRLDELIHHCAKWIDRDVLIHFANTHAMLRDVRHHRQMLRIGLALHGFGAGDMFGGIPDVNLPALRPVMSWMSTIAHIREVPTGTPVGYGSTFTTYRDSRLAVVPLGYADGYPVALSNQSVVRVGSGRAIAHIRGRISMDQMTIDITDIPDAQLRTPIEVYSSDPAAPNSVSKLAKLAETNIYELICRINPRIKRQYVIESKK